jgi:hypothetical protein
MFSLAHLRKRDNAEILEAREGDPTTVGRNVGIISGED